MTFIKKLFSAAVIACIGVSAQAEDIPLGQQAIAAMPELTSHGNPLPVEVTGIP